MIIVTGGTGFIGSCVHAALYARGERTAIVDWLGAAEKWRNIAAHAPDFLVAPEDIDGFLAARRDIRAIVHFGAISETTATDGDLVWSTNVALSQKLWRWCSRHGVRFIYASSAATYGAGEIFSDNPQELSRLRPLNLYGWSKHVFDQYVMRECAHGRAVPPQWAGLKFFNVYGPNEYHKGKMISVVKVKYDEIMSGVAPRLFRSDVAGLADGEQRRDFIWVGDVVDVVLWLLDHPDVSGIFNCGTGVARTYKDLAYAVCDALGVGREVEFVDMPARLRGQYQSYTCADMARLRQAGYEGQFTPLEKGVARYIQDFLKNPEPYL